MPRGMTTEQRFWTKVDKSGEHWLWTGMTNGRNGQFTLIRYPKNVRTPAHAYAWTERHGPIPAGHLLVPTCDVRLCVRPEHWRPGTKADLPQHADERRVEAFWARVPQVSGDDACWPWTGRCGSNGYGQFSWRSRTLLAHRVAWTLSRGRIPGGLFVCHRCDNPPCCRPDHLFLGTPADNSGDMVAKGRSARDRAVLHGAARLTEDQVREVRRRYAAGEGSTHTLAREYGVASMTLWKVATGRTYRWVR